MIPWHALAFLDLNTPVESVSSSFSLVWFYLHFVYPLSIRRAATDVSSLRYDLCPLQLRAYHEEYLNERADRLRAQRTVSSKSRTYKSCGCSCGCSTCWDLVSWSCSEILHRNEDYTWNRDWLALAGNVTSGFPFVLLWWIIFTLFEPSTMDMNVTLKILSKSLPFSLNLSRYD